ncbi:ABC transporter substrate-binding protein [Desnuesiella massiliensis]|uniref:ABC transporter substrate-binding protein n=1 Tax=Desnuesiella massiliensis TaxID=1650662 RepID=UPI001A9A5C4A|nr:extracellular solute-binding protein [Desnuesiella massiliensis]
MSSKKVRVLAVGDPAVEVYVDKNYKILDRWKNNNSIDIDFNIASWENYYNTMMEDFKAEEPNYDIVMVAGHFWLRDFVENKFISPMDDYMNLLPKDYEYEDILPIIREEMKLDGHQYLLPSFCDGHMVLYRKSIVKEVLGYLPKECITIDELISMVEKVDGFKGLRGIALKAHVSEILTDFLPYLRSEGIDLFDEDHKPSFYNDKGIKALNKYIVLRKYAPVNTNEFGNVEIKDQIQQKKAVFAITWGGQLGVVLNEQCEEPEDIGFATLDKPWNVTWSFALNNNSKNKEDAVRFLAYLTSKDIDKLVGSYAGSPVRKSTYLDETERSKCSWYDAHLEMVEKYAKPLPSLKGSGEILGILYEYISKAFNYELSAEEALRTAHKKIMQCMR